LIADKAIYYYTVYTTLFYLNNGSIVCNEITAGLDERTWGWNGVGHVSTQFWDGVGHNDCGDVEGLGKIFWKICGIGDKLCRNGWGSLGNPVQASITKPKIGSECITYTWILNYRRYRWTPLHCPSLLLIFNWACPSKEPRLVIVIQCLLNTLSDQLTSINYWPHPTPRLDLQNNLP